MFILIMQQEEYCTCKDCVKAYLTALEQIKIEEQKTKPKWFIILNGLISYKVLGDVGLTNPQLIPSYA